MNYVIVSLFLSTHVHDTAGILLSLSTRVHDSAGLLIAAPIHFPAMSVTY